MDFLLEALSTPLAEDRTYVVAIFSGALLLLLLVVPAHMAAKLIKHAGTSDTAVVSKYGATVRSFRSFYADVLPTEFQYETSFDAAAQLLYSQHDLSIFANTKQNYFHVKRTWARLLMKSLSILTWNVIIGLLYYQSTQSCHARTNKIQCSNDSAVVIMGSLCKWNSVGQQCEDASQNEFFGFVLVVVVAVILVTSATDKAMRSAGALATLAVQSRRWSWLYCCFVRDMPHPSSLDKRGRITVQGKKVRVMPAPVDRSGVPFGADDLEGGGSDTSFEEGGALRVKPKGRVGGVATRLAALLPVSLPFRKYRLRTSAQFAARPVSLKQLLQAEEDALQHYGDEWLSLSVQSRKAT